MTWDINTEPSLDDVIKKYTEVTNRWIRDAEKSSLKNDREEVGICLFHAGENYQITKWLTELKELRGRQESLKARCLISGWIVDEREDDRIWKCHCAHCGQDPQIWIGGTENWWVRTLPDFCPSCGACMWGNT